MNNYLKLILVFFSLFIYSETNAKPETDSALDDKIKQTVDAYIEGGYIKVPRREYELEMEKVITSKINKSITTLLGFTAAILSVLGFFQFRQNKSIREILTNQTTVEINSRVNKFQEELKKIISEENSNSEKLLKKEIQIELNLIHQLIKNIEEKIKTIKSESDESFHQAKQQVMIAREYMANLELQQLEYLVAKSIFNPEDLTRAKKLLAEFEGNEKTKFQVPRILDVLCAIYYDSQLDEDKEINELMSKYENDYPLKSTTYIIGALAAFSDYHEFNAISQRKNALVYLEKALEQTGNHDYGESLGLKIVIYLIDYLRADEDEPKRTAINNILDILKLILDCENPTPSFEAVSRLMKHWVLEPQKKYLLTLYDLFPDKLTELFNRANAYAEEYLPDRDEKFDISIFQLENELSMNNHTVK